VYIFSTGNKVKNYSAPKELKLFVYIDNIKLLFSVSACKDSFGSYVTV